MDLFLNFWFWLVTGALLILAELIIPGGIVIFLGLGALTVAGAVQFGLVSTWTGALTLFFIASLALIVLLRSLTQKVAEGDSSVDNTDEALDAFGEIVDVVQDIGPGNEHGRVRFRGSDWQALSDGSLLPSGRQAKVVSFDNITVIVEPIEQDGSNATG